jgi:ferritin-like metal-binding protein YciE
MGMSETEKQFQNELNSLDVKMQKEVYDEAMDNAFLGSVQKIEHPEIAILKQRITELEQQLKTARHEAVEQYLEGQLKSVKLSRSLQNKSPLI